MTQRQVKAIFDQLRANYQDAESEVMVDMIVYLNSVGAAFSGPTSYDASTGLLMMNGNTWIRAEQISALSVREVRETTS
jgi:hypothetical protein